MSHYHTQLIRKFESLIGATISDWSGVEMALTEGCEGGEIWEHLSVPYLQMFVIEATLVSGNCFRIYTDQADTIWGLSIREGPLARGVELELSGIYREGDLSYLPRGHVEDVEVTIADGLIRCVTIIIGVSKIQFLPGEVYEEPNGNFRIVMQDESVLVQLDGVHPKQNKTQMATPRKSSD